MVLIKQEFIKHGWKIRNEFEFDGCSYYDAVKGEAKLSVAERKLFTEIKYKDKHICVNRKAIEIYEEVERMFEYGC